MPMTEELPQRPTNPYGESKLMLEKILLWCQERKGLEPVFLRYFNACGAMPNRGEAHQPESHLIPLVLRVALGQSDAIKIFGADYPTPDGTCIRDYVHIADLADAHILALSGLSERDRLIYNLGSGHGYSVREVIDTARQVTGQLIQSIEHPRRPGDSARLVASSEKIKRELGWKPQHDDLREIISSAWEWHKSHPHGYEG